MVGLLLFYVTQRSFLPVNLCYRMSYRAREVSPSLSAVSCAQQNHLLLGGVGAFAHEYGAEFVVALY